MSLRLRTWLAAAAVLAATMFAPSVASAAISVASPIANNTYVDSVYVSWSVTTLPKSISMVWTCTGGYCLNTVTSPITLNLVSTATKSTLSYNPSAATNAVFSNWPGPMPDGTWSVQMKYVDSATTVTFSSTTITNVRVSTETLPPTLTGLTAGAATNLRSISVSYTLPSTPSVSVKPTLTFTNTATSTASVLTLTTATSGSFNLDPANLSAAAAVLSVTGPNDLSGGTYDVTLSYQDGYGHPAATVTVSNWTFDTATQPPSLSPPAGSGAQNGPFDLNFDLPEAALANSVQLSFSGGSVPITLSLADTTAGTHTVHIDPNNLSAGADVLSASASTLPPGSYSVTLAYQDALGNPISISAPASLTVAGPVTPTPVPTTTTPSTPVGTGTTPVTGTSGTAASPCPAATGRVTGRLIGRIVLAMHRTAIQHAFRSQAAAGSPFDRCSGVGGTLTVGYPSASYLQKLPASQRRWVRGRAVLILTTISSQWIDRMHAGMRLTAALARLKHAHRFQRGNTIWYAVRQRHRTVLVSVTHGTIRQIGLAAPIVATTRRQQLLLLTSL